MPKKHKISSPLQNKIIKTILERKTQLHGRNGSREQIDWTIERTSERTNNKVEGGTRKASVQSLF